MRLISTSEISRAMSCEASWDFSYGDTLAGSSLKPKRYAPRLQEGRAWGSMVAAFHANVHEDHPGGLAIVAMNASLEADKERMIEFGVFDETEYLAMRERLLKMFSHHIDVVEHWQADPIVEHEFKVPIPSRDGGPRRSNRYQFHGFVDATRQIDGQLWIVEFKLRSKLTEVEFIQLDRQIRRYAWAWWQITGDRPVGVEVHERWNEVPRPARLVKGRRKDQEMVPSHAKDQLCTPEAYYALCDEYDVEINRDTLRALDERRWAQTVPILFRPGELEEAGKELVSAAQLIRDLDGGRWPVRNAKPQLCRSCAFREICPAPDEGLVDALYERVPPKRTRKPREEA